mmetsp:Transcript_92200/g.298506  ORF Transcript_92200/g.298506 Transcript_92200/m.298506 type:complete len:150 (+) Transcript_92200:555-1004(+)
MGQKCTVALNLPTWQWQQNCGPCALVAKVALEALEDRREDWCLVTSPSRPLASSAPHKAPEERLEETEDRLEENMDGIEGDFCTDVAESLPEFWRFKAQPSGSSSCSPFSCGGDGAAMEGGVVGTSASCGGVRSIIHSCVAQLFVSEGT